MQLLALERKAFRHPRSGLGLLLGRLGKSRHCLIGGSWEPADGPPPVRDPSVLLATAIRTFREATGLDLSACLQWDKLIEISYVRKRKGRAGGGSMEVERTVVFLVDAWRVAVEDASVAQAISDARRAPELLEAAKEELAASQTALIAAPTGSKAGGGGDAGQVGGGAGGAPRSAAQRDDGGGGPGGAGQEGPGHQVEPPQGQEGPPGPPAGVAGCAKEGAECSSRNARGGGSVQGCRDRGPGTCCPSHRRATVGGGACGCCPQASGRASSHGGGEAGSQRGFHGQGQEVPSGAGATGEAADTLHVRLVRGRVRGGAGGCRLQGDAGPALRTGHFWGPPSSGCREEGGRRRKQEEEGEGSKGRGKGGEEREGCGSKKEQSREPQVPSRESN
eukprot:jgi/Botrbrau1/18639/Bobra.0367s0075.1